MPPGCRLLPRSCPCQRFDTSREMTLDDHVRVEVGFDSCFLRDRGPPVRVDSRVGRCLEDALAASNLPWALQAPALSG
jgi:hypothetical protein